MKDYIDVIDELEKIEEIVAPPKYKRCCFLTLEVIKTIIKNLKYNINAKKKEEQKAK